MKYNKLWQRIAEDTDKRPTALFKELGISLHTYYTMRNPDKDLYGRNAGSVNLVVIDKLCSRLHCQPCDIMEL